jgi:hypothetical protein
MWCGDRRTGRGRVTLAQHLKTDNCLLAQSFASLEPMKSLNEDKPISVSGGEDRGFLPDLLHILGNLADSDFGDWESSRV